MMPDDDRIAELRRIAFGRTRSAEDEARAEAAHLELEALLAPPAAVAAPTPESQPEPEAEPVAAPGPAPERRRTAWVLPAAAALVVGVLLGAGAMAATGRGIPATAVAPTPTFTPGSSGLPSEVDPLRASLALEEGSIEGAQVWLSGEQNIDDKLPSSTYIYEGLNLDASSTRLALAGPRGTVWVATTTDGKYCIFVRTDSQTGGDCVAPETLVSTGLSVLADSRFLVAWNGERMATSTATR
jgi:hypothetical protein